MKFPRVRGTQDKLSLGLEAAVLQKVREHFDLYGFSEIQTPVLEREELFTSSLGEATDIVTKEIFRIVGSLSGRENICLRPEATAGSIRAFLENRGQLEEPWKIFSYGPMFRYERPQKGRWRQFDQFNIEMISVKTFHHDVELLLSLDRLFERVFGMHDYCLKINFLGNLSERNRYKEFLQKFLIEQKENICEHCSGRIETNPLRALDCKNQDCSLVYKKAPKIVDALEEESRAIFEKIKNSLNLLCVNFVEDKNLVRGLDYYQGLVFEFVSSALGSQDAFCGGGHYELAKKFEQKEEVQSIGAAIGIGRLMLLFDAAMQEQLMTAKKQDLCVVLPLTSEQNEISIHTADHLRENEIKAVVILEELSIKSKMKKANKADAKFVIIIGQEEQEKNSATLKNMQSGHEELVLLTGLPAKLHSTSC